MNSESSGLDRDPHPIGFGDAGLKLEGNPVSELHGATAKATLTARKGSWAGRPRVQECGRARVGRRRAFAQRPPFGSSGRSTAGGTFRTVNSGGYLRDGRQWGVPSGK